MQIKKYSAAVLLMIITVGAVLPCLAGTATLYDPDTDIIAWKGKQIQGLYKIRKNGDKKHVSFLFPDSKIYFIHKLSGKKLWTNKCDLLVLKVRAADKQSIGRKITVSLNVSGKQRYWSHFKLKSLDWHQVGISLNDSPVGKDSLKFQPGIEPSSLQRVNSITLLCLKKKGKKSVNVPVGMELDAPAKSLNNYLSH